MMETYLNDDENDPALISKNFWTHLKSTNKSTRIPESMYITIVGIGIILKIRPLCLISFFQINSLRQALMIKILTGIMMRMMI